MMTQEKCQWCGVIHGPKCPEVRAIEYHQDGTIKRVEFITRADRYPAEVHHHHQPSDLLSEAEKERIGKEYLRRVSRGGAP